jgi:hypothetical protein
MKKIISLLLCIAMMSLSSCDALFRQSEVSESLENNQSSTEISQGDSEEETVSESNSEDENEPNDENSESGENLESDEGIYSEILEIPEDEDSPIEEIGPDGLNLQCEWLEGSYMKNDIFFNCAYGVTEEGLYNYFGGVPALEQAEKEGWGCCVFFYNYDRQLAWHESTYLEWALEETDEYKTVAVIEKRISLSDFFGDEYVVDKGANGELVFNKHEVLHFPQELLTGSEGAIGVTVALYHAGCNHHIGTYYANTYMMNYEINGEQVVLRNYQY